jgi:cytochrome c2
VAADDATQATTEDTAQEAVSEEPVSEDASEDVAENAAEDEPAQEEAVDVAEAAPAEEDAAEPAAADAAAGGSAFAALVAAADLDDGQKVFKKCAACHVADKEQNRVGPHLVGLIDREVASVDGFGYSDVLSGLGGVWDVDRLSAWLESPRDFAPGNRMSFRGITDEQDRADLIGYLQSLGQ